MNRSGFGRVQQQAARTVMPGTTRQATGTAPIGSRGAQFRAGQMQRGAPAQRGATNNTEEDDDEKPADEKEPLFSRSDDETGDASEIDSDEADAADDEADGVKVIVVS